MERLKKGKKERREGGSRRGDNMRKLRFQLKVEHSAHKNTQQIVSFRELKCRDEKAACTPISLKHSFLSSFYGR